MVMLYLVVRTLLPLLAFVLAWWLLSRLINARVARMPRVPLNLPEHSSSPRRKDRRIYARKLRRKPGLRTATRAATAPRSWHVAAAILSLMALIATVLVIPDGARFQVMVDNLTGYAGTVVEAQVPVAAQPVVLDAWQPALAQLGRPTAMRYPIGRTGGEHEAHAVVPVQVRQQGDRLQVAIALPLDTEMLRAELARLAGLPIEAIDVQQREVAPWREADWQPLPGP
ncbi:transmembrane protein [Stenotrophomonas maltophilia]|nr:transmembrane protein [Stenotrophomonas maltophilia]